MGKGGGGVKISARVSAYLGFKPNYFLDTDLQVGRGGVKTVARVSPFWT